MEKDRYCKIEDVISKHHLIGIRESVRMKRYLISRIEKNHPKELMLDGDCLSSRGEKYYVEVILEALNFFQFSDLKGEATRNKVVDWFDYQWTKKEMGLTKMRNNKSFSPLWMEDPTIKEFKEKNDLTKQTWYKLKETYSYVKKGIYEENKQRFIKKETANRLMKNELASKTVRVMSDWIADNNTKGWLLGEFKVKPIKEKREKVRKARRQEVGPTIDNIRNGLSDKKSGEMIHLYEEIHIHEFYRERFAPRYVKGIRGQFTSTKRITFFMDDVMEYKMNSFYPFRDEKKEDRKRIVREKEIERMIGLIGSDIEIEGMEIDELSTIYGLDEERLMLYLQFANHKKMKRFITAKAIQNLESICSVLHGRRLSWVLGEKNRIDAAKRKEKKEPKKRGRKREWTHFEDILYPMMWEGKVTGRQKIITKNGESYFVFRFIGQPLTSGFDEKVEIEIPLRRLKNKFYIFIIDGIDIEMEVIRYQDAPAVKWIKLTLDGSIERTLLSEEELNENS